MSTALARQSDAAPLDIQEIEQLLRSVNETTERLQSTHVALRHEVARLQGELAEANARLRRSKTLAALGEMAAGIAHEVRNPLGSIRLDAQMLAEDLAGRPRQRQLCDKIGRAVERLDAIVRDVLHFACNTAVTPRCVTAGELLAEALEGCRSVLAEADVAVTGPAPAEAAVPLPADPSLMVQALCNVIRNAAEAMAESESPRRELLLTVAREARRAPDGARAPRVVLGVHDTGPGIASDVIDRMFNPFFTTRRTGTGLGLAIVHRIVDAHGGHVSAAVRPGGGSTVELCLPPSATE